MNNVIIGFLLTSVLFIWLFGWWGVALILLFLLGAWGHSKSGARPGPVECFIEKLGIDDESQK